MNPLVSVILPVYNNATYIREAVESILTQSYINFELIVVNDQSTDETLAMLNAFDDPRIVIINNETNLGRAGSDNAAVKVAKGKYIAKMDGDDISHPDRLKVQVQVLEQNEAVNVVGSFMQNFGTSTYLNTYPEDPETARCLTLFTLPVGNPSVMLRAELFKVKLMYYNEQLRQSEDYDFFARYIKDLTIYNVQRALIDYRTYSDTFKDSILQDRKNSAVKIQHDLLVSWGIPFEPEEFSIHEFVTFGGNRSVDEKSLYATRDWLLKMKEYNRLVPFFEQQALEQMLAQKWFDTCYNRAPKKTNTLKIFNQVNGLLGAKINLSFIMYCKFIFKNVLKK